MSNEVKTPEQIAAEINAKLAAVAEAKAAELAAKLAAKAEAQAAKTAANLAAHTAKTEAAAIAKAAKAEASAAKKAAKALELSVKKAARAAEKAAKVAEPAVVKLPRSDTDSAKVWAFANQLSAQLGRPALRKDVTSAATAIGINEATANTQYARWRVFHGITGRVVAPVQMSIPA